MEMVLGVRIPSEIIVPWERIGRVGCLLALSGVLYCSVREYTVDFRRGMSENVICGQEMKTDCGGEGERIYGIVSGVPADLEGQELRNALGWEITGYLQKAGLSDRVEAVRTDTAGRSGVWGDRKDAEPVEDWWNVAALGPAWGVGKTEMPAPAGDLPQGQWNTGIGDSEIPDIPYVDVPSVDVREEDVPSVDIREEDVPIVDIGEEDVPSVDIGEDVPSVDVPEEETGTGGKGESIEIAGFIVDSQGYITGVTDNLVLMDGILAVSADPECMGIRADAFLDIEEEVIEIYIPANICDIEQGAFDCFPLLMYIEAAEDHSCYHSEDGILYSENGEEIAYPTGR